MVSKARAPRVRVLTKRKASAKCRWPRNRSTWSLLFICRQDRKCLNNQALSLFAGVVPDNRRTNEGVTYTGISEKSSKVRCFNEAEILEETTKQKRNHAP